MSMQKLNRGLLGFMVGAFVALPVLAAPTGIQIATKKYSDAQFAPLETRVNTVAASLDSVVTDTINQAGSAAQYSSNKQNRPSENCPSGMKCLLVKHPTNGDMWYPITTCNAFFENVMANGTSYKKGASTGDGYFATALIQGAKRNDGSLWAECQSGGELASVTQACSANGSWGMKYYEVSGSNPNSGDSYGTTEMGWVAGIGGWATVPSGTQEGDVVTLSTSDVNKTSASGKNAFVCMVTHYKGASDSSVSAVSETKAYVLSMGDYVANASIDGCSETMARDLGNPLYSELVCPM